MRGRFDVTQALVSGLGQVPVEDAVVTDEATEFTVARMGAYAAILMSAAK